MTELETLRKELNEIRERLAKLEARQPHYVGPPVAAPFRPTSFPIPYEKWPLQFPPGTIICGTNGGGSGC